jgi:hypothetical protein
MLHTRKNQVTTWKDSVQVRELLRNLDAHMEAALAVGEEQRPNEDGE